MTPAGTRIVGYCRCSTKDQAENGASFEAQRTAIMEAAERRGWTVVAMLEEQVSGGAKARPVRDAAIAMIEAGGADALVAAKLDRVTRSLVDFGPLAERARSKGWAIVVLDMDFDMTTPTGELMANMLVSFAQFERRLIGQRTREGLAVKRAGGTRLGRPVGLPDAVVGRIQRDRAAGMSLAAIAHRLNDDAIPTGQGGAQWYPSTVRNVLVRTGAHKTEGGNR
jgi:DNA invertase Pin-like site-specific DNA recombinase